MNNTPPSSTARHSEQAWAFLAEIVRARREHIGLSQEDIKDAGGPGKSTVSKIERAAQHGYPQRTYRQIEQALGWSWGAASEVLRAADEPNFEDHRSTIAHDLIEGDMPAVSAPARTAADLTDDELLAELTYRMTRYAREKGAGHVESPAQKSDSGYSVEDDEII